MWWIRDFHGWAGGVVSSDASSRNGKGLRMNPDFWMRMAVGISHAWSYDQPADVSKNPAPPQRPRVVVASPPDPVRSEADFEEQGEITVAAEYGAVLGFVAVGDDGLIALTGVNRRYGSRNTVNRGIQIPNRLVQLDQRGEERWHVKLDWSPRGLTRADDGTVYVVGDTTVAWYSASGDLVGHQDAPHFSLPKESSQEFQKEVVERRDLTVNQQARSLKQREDALQALEEKPKEKRTPADNASMKSLAQQITTHKQSLEHLQKKTPEQLLTEAVTQAKQLHRVAVSHDHVFLVSNETAGYGYAVWRCDRTCESPVKIIGGLRGCCGQMDLQLAGDKLIIAENSRHRVLVTDFEGVTVTTFGKRDSNDKENGFGGCCNPMNTCRAPDGGLLTSESHGLIKRYALDGSFQGVVGVANVASGCKNSTVGISADGKTVYFLDVTKGRIVRFTQREDAVDIRG